jgi:outer membrane protein
VRFLCGLLLSYQAQTHASDLLDIYQQATVADPIYRTAVYDHQASREILKQARSGYLPSVSVRYDWIETDQEILSSDNILFDKGQADFSTSIVELNLTQPVYRYANYIRIQQAKDEILQADIELEKSRQDLILRAAENYLYALAGDDLIDYLNSERTALEKHLMLARAKEKANLGRTTDTLEAEARLASVIADYAEAEVSRRDAYEKLAEMTDEYTTDLNRLQKDFPLKQPEPAEADHWVDAALEQNLEMEVQRKALEVSRLEIKIEKAGHYPTVDLKLRKNITDAGGTVFGGGSKVDTGRVMLSFELPIYQGGSVNSKSRAASARYRRDNEEMTRLTRQVKRESRRNFSSIVNAIARVRALEKQVEAQESGLKLKRTGYKSALYSNLQVLDAERDLYSAKRDRARARYEYLLNSLRLRAIVGTLSEDDLLLLNRWLTVNDNI